MMRQLAYAAMASGKLEGNRAVSDGFICRIRL